MKDSYRFVDFVWGWLDLRLRNDSSQLCRCWRSFWDFLQWPQHQRLWQPLQTDPKDFLRLWPPKLKKRKKCMIFHFDLIFRENTTKSEFRDFVWFNQVFTIYFVNLLIFVFREIHQYTCHTNTFMCPPFYHPLNLLRKYVESLNRYMKGKF